MKGLNLPKLDLELPELTKYYLASGERKLWDSQSLIDFLFARNLIYVHRLDYLNKDAAIATVHYCKSSNLGLNLKEQLPFKFERVFKSYHGRLTPVPIAFICNMGINLVRMIQETGKKHAICVDSDKKAYFKQLTDVCFRELDKDPSAYANVDFSPKGDVRLTMRHFDHPDGTYSIVAWLSGNWDK